MQRGPDQGQSGDFRAAAWAGVVYRGVVDPLRGSQEEGASGEHAGGPHRLSWHVSEAARRQSTQVTHFPRGGVSGCGQRHTWVWTEESRGPGGCLQESHRREGPE